LIEKDKRKFQLYFFLHFLVIKTLDPDPDSDSLEMRDPDTDYMNLDSQHLNNFLPVFPTMTP
jgi:hypothetical protein